MVKNIGGAAWNASKNLRFYSELKKDLHLNEPIIARLKTKNFQIGSSFGVNYDRVRIILHPDDFKEVRIAQLLHKELNDKIDEKIGTKGVGGLQNAFNIASNILVSVSAIQYGSALYGFLGEKNEEIVKKILSEDKVEEKVLKERIQRALNSCIQLASSLK